MTDNICQVSLWVHEHIFTPEGNEQVDCQSQHCAHLCHQEEWDSTELRSLIKQGIWNGLLFDFNKTHVLSVHSQRFKILYFFLSIFLFIELLCLSPHLLSILQILKWETYKLKRIISLNSDWERQKYVCHIIILTYNLWDSEFITLKLHAWNVLPLCFCWHRSLA